MAVLLLSLLLLLMITANEFMYLFVPQPKIDFNKEQQLLADMPAQGVPYDSLKEAGREEDKLETRPDTDTAKASQKSNEPQVLDVNTADSTTLLNLKGIGPVFAGRIVKYRNLLGGYVNIQQLQEVYGLTKETYNAIAPYVVVNNPKPKKINLNTATFKEVNRHPYIEYELTKAIFSLKKKQGKLTAVDDIKKTGQVSPELYNKLLPYLTVE